MLSRLSWKGREKLFDKIKEARDCFIKVPVGTHPVWEYHREDYFIGAILEGDTHLREETRRLQNPELDAEMRERGTHLCDRHRLNQVCKGR